MAIKKWVFFLQNFYVDAQWSYLFIFPFDMKGQMEDVVPEIAISLCRWTSFISSSYASFIVFCWALFRVYSI